MPASAVTKAKAVMDLHIHTTCSDGRLTPAQAVAAALDRGLGMIAIADPIKETTPQALEALGGKGSTSSC